MILANLFTWYILAFSYSGIHFSVNSINFSLNGGESQVTTSIQLDQRGSFLFTADDREWVLTRVSAQTFFYPFPVEVSKNDTQWRYS